MLSSRFAVNVRPERWIQQLIASGSLGAALCGLLLLALLPLPLWLVAVLSVLLLATSLEPVWTAASGNRSICELRCRPDRQWRALFDNGIWRSVELLPGSRIGSALVWLRCSDDAGAQLWLLLRQRGCRAEDWRRLQVLLRLPPA